MATIKVLHELGYISIVTKGSQTSPTSLQIKWEEELAASIRGQSRRRIILFCRVS